MLSKYNTNSSNSNSCSVQTAHLGRKRCRENRKPANNQAQESSYSYKPTKYSTSRSDS